MLVGRTALIQAIMAKTLGFNITNRRQMLIHLASRSWSNRWQWRWKQACLLN